MEKMNKELGTLSLFSIASGAMISSGLFVLPAIAYAKTGTMLIAAYLVASFLMIPAMLSKAELATAMPKSGGTYFYVNRSLGALMGTFAGLSNWLSLALKSAFALIGIGVFLEPILMGALPESLIAWQPWIIKGIAALFTLLFTCVNLANVKDSSKLQNFLVAFLLTSLIAFIIAGFFYIKPEYYSPLTPKNATFGDFFATVGLIFISYGGLTKIASVAAEVKNPGKTLPRSMFYAFFVVSAIYVLGVTVAIGLLPHNQLMGTLTPLSTAAKVFAGSWGWWILAIAASTAFITTANAGILAASRSPFAMAEDSLIPPFFGKLSGKNKVPANAILFTAFFMLMAILFLDTEKLAKVASAMMLLLYSLDCISLIIMRASNIPTYKPQYKSPLFPYLQISGMFIYIMLIIGMGWLPTLITGIFLALSVCWYFGYSRKRSSSESALILLVEKLSKRDFGRKERTPDGATLAHELREILFERDEIRQDRFDKLILEATILDLDNLHPEVENRSELFQILGNHLTSLSAESASEIAALFEKREEESTTNISEGVAIPHVIYSGSHPFQIVVARSKKGIVFRQGEKPVHIIFAISGTGDDRNFYLKCLMSIAQILNKESFKKNWIKLKNIEELRNMILIAERTRN